MIGQESMLVNLGNANHIQTEVTWVSAIIQKQGSSGNLLEIIERGDRVGCDQLRGKRIPL